MRACKTIQINNDEYGRSYSIHVSKNQKVIKINKTSNGINFEANRRAMKGLKADTYLLYMYLLLNQTGRIWALSSKDVFDSTALTRHPYDKALQELIDKNYLVKGKIDIGDGLQYGENTYNFYETPIS